MKIIISPDSFKGSISAKVAADQIEAGILAVFPEAETLKLPMADGGEGTVEAFLTITKGEKTEHEVKDPRGNIIRATYCWMEEEKTAIIETAAASGLVLVPPNERDPDLLTTYGTGQLVGHALNKGARKIILTLGGSATVDGGTGCLQALGAIFKNSEGTELDGNGKVLAEMEELDFSGIDPRLREVEFVVASDVQNPLLGAEGAVRMFGPQKGLLSPERLDQYELNMKRFADLVKATGNRDERNSAGAGAAGGLGFGLHTVLPEVQMMRGFDLVAELSHLKEELKNADLIITGEGKFDSQSLLGKVPSGLSRLAEPYEVPIIVFTGHADMEWTAGQQGNIGMIVPIIDRVMTLDQAMVQGESLLYEAVKRFFETVLFTKARMGSLTAL